MSITAGPAKGASQPWEVPSSEGPPGGESHLEKLEMPEQGHSRAARWWWAGVIVYFALASVLLRTLDQADQAADSSGGSILSLFGLGPTKNLAVTVLVAAGVLLFIASSIYVRKDIDTLANEEDDIEFVDRTRGRRPDLVFVDHDERERILISPTAVRSPKRARVESLLDDRVRRVDQARLGGGGGVSVEEMRIVAEKRSARLGSFARYASSLLLLLAVLGTFAGVKTALPWLIQAVSAPTSDTMALARPLQAIAAAFGGNALALVGAIAVGLMAQGVAFGRQNMLERLELVSAEFVYGSDTAASGDPMQQAIQALRGTTKEFQNASGALLGIETGLNELGGQFRTALDGLGDRLGEIADRQETGLYDKTGASLEALQLRVGELTKSVEANAHAYAGLIASIRDRTEETRAAVGNMEDANRKLAGGIEGLLGVGQKAQETFTEAKKTFDVMESAATRLADSGATAMANAAELTAPITSLQTSADAMSVSMSGISEHLAAAEDRAERAVNSVAAVITKKMDSMPGPAPLQPPSRQDVARSDSPEVLSALRQIAVGIDDLRSTPRPSTLMQLAIPGAAAAICVVLSYGIIQLFRYVIRL